MAKFVSLSLIFLLAGCASVQGPGYISRADHVYDRQIYAGFEKVVSSMMFVLKNKGWPVIDEVDPSIYERDDRYDNSSYQNILIMTGVRKKFLHVTSSMHLNVFIHSIGNTCNVEIRTSSRNNLLASDILDAVEEEVSR